jgi:hypothetical protein
MVWSTAHLGSSERRAGQADALGEWRPGINTVSWRWEEKREKFWILIVEIFFM